jgi:uncharacterized protein involved in exopolysaccharide biosynthesis
MKGMEVTSEISGKGKEGQSAAQEAIVGQQEASLLDFAIVLGKHKSLVLVLPALVASIAAAVTLLISNTYTATIRILPPVQNQSAAAALLGQLSGLAAISGGPPTLKNFGDMYVGMLRSDSVLDGVIEKFHLQRVYEKTTRIETRLALIEATKIVSGKDGIIVLHVEDVDAKRAADLANAYLHELDKLNERIAVTEAGQRRIFFEKQLSKAKDALATAELALKKTQETTGLIKLDEQGKVLIESVAQLRAQIAAKEVQIGAMRTFATNLNPELIRNEQELIGLREQLRRMEKHNPHADGDVFIPTGRVPEAGLEYVRRLRELKYQEALFELLVKQLEIAKLDEAKNASIIQIIDRATVPDKKSKPNRAVITITTGVISFVLCILLALLIEAKRRLSVDPVTSSKLKELYSHLSPRGRR